VPRYLVERSFPDVRTLPVERVIDVNTDDGVSWLHSYVSVDARTMVCVYDAPSPEAIRKAARRSDLPVDRITQVRVLDPYSYDLRRQR
jgi:hypothetical protein